MPTWTGSFNSLGSPTLQLQAVIGTESQAGLIILEARSTDILIGMDFLRKFSKTLFVHDKNQLVALFDDTDVEDLLTQLAKAIHAQQQGSPAPASQNPTPAEAEVQNPPEPSATPE